MTAWDFEIKHNKEAAFDGAKIINLKYKYPIQPHLYSYFELYSKGKLNISIDGKTTIEQPSFKFFDKDDLMFIANKMYNDL